jgi:Domain of unknown function (DUF1996)
MVMAQVQFPDCWDGANLDSSNHRSHMAYARDATSNAPAATCPSTHPVQLPQMTIDISYATAIRPLRLSSGDHNTLHSDFFNGCEPTRLQFLVDYCLNGFRRCDSGGP